MPIMLLRNLNGARGLANGSRLTVRKTERYMIDAEITSGSHVGKRVFFPRIILTPSEDSFRMPYKLKRRQFLVRLAFAKPINKMQGQTLQRMGLFLPAHVFSHGKLYAALSRAGSAQQASVSASVSAQGELHGQRTALFTGNVVFKEVFR